MHANILLAQASRARLVLLCYPCSCLALPAQIPPLATAPPDDRKHAAHVLDDCLVEADRVALTVLPGAAIRLRSGCGSQHLWAHIEASSAWVCLPQVPTRIQRGCAGRVLYRELVLGNSWAGVCRRGVHSLGCPASTGTDTARVDHALRRCRRALSLVRFLIFTQLRNLPLQYLHRVPQRRDLPATRSPVVVHRDPGPLCYSSWPNQDQLCLQLMRPQVRKVQHEGETSPKVEKWHGDYLKLHLQRRTAGTLTPRSSR